MRKVLTVISLLAVIGLAVLNLTYQPGPDPDLILPMANQHIDWHYAGQKNP